MEVEVVPDPVIISWSEIDKYRQCPFAHMITYRDRWSEPTVSRPLARGNLWHKSVMEPHYLGIQALGKRPRTAKAFAPTVAKIERNLGLKADRDQTEDEALVSWMYQGYLEKWGLDPEWEIVAVEWKGFSPLPNPHGGPSRFMLKIKIDLIVRFRGRLWIIDHKTGKDLPSDKELDLDDQFGLYTWLMRQINQPIMGSWHSAARTQRNKGPMELDTRFRRTLLNRTDIELDTIAAEAYQTAERMWPEQFSDLLPERTPNTDTCRWRCSFTEACLLARKGGRLADMLKAHGCTQSQFRQVEIEWNEHKDKQ